MNKIALKQRQTKIQPAKLKEKKTSRKVCRCSPTRCSKKGTQTKSVRNQTKIKKVINNIRTLCSDGKMQNCNKDLNNKSSSQSVIYVGPCPKQSCPVIDLTNSSYSLEQFKQNTLYGDNQMKTIYLSGLRTGGFSCFPKPSRPTSMINLTVPSTGRIVRRNCLQLSSSAGLLNERSSVLYRKLAALDLPERYREEVNKDFDTECRVHLDSYDQDTMDMILDMEDEYQLFVNGKLQTYKFFDPNIDARDLIDQYLLDNSGQ